ncbi:Speckle-type POZ protein-like isoform X2 [Aphelenchoides besseyi]|nr:Speckle-type POZ protein-like isoform X2 [Aphelenchoides besseyi]
MESQLELLRLFESTFNDGEHWDFIVKVENTEFKVLKSFLKINSEVFKRMFEGDFSESKNNTVEIKEFSAPPIEHLLRFCYCGKLEATDETLIVQIYEASDKYQIHQLKSICSKKLRELSTHLTVLQRLMWAEKYTDEALIETLIDVAVKNVEFISKQDELELLFITVPEIAHKLFTALVAAHSKCKSPPKPVEAVARTNAHIPFF